MNRSCRLERAQIRLEDREVAPRLCVVDVLGHGSHDLQLDRRPLASGGAAGSELLAGHFVPAQPKVIGNVVRPPDPRGARTRRATPTPARAGWWLRVVAVAGLRREVDAADEGDAVVDDDRLLVMAVHRPLARVRGALNLRVARPAARAWRARLRATGERAAAARRPTRARERRAALRARPAGCEG